MKEFQPEKAQVASGFLTEDASRDRGSFIRNQASGRRRGGRNGQLDNLLGLKDMRGSDAGSTGANVKGLGELNKFDAQCVSAPEKDGYLNADAGVLPLVRGGHRCLGSQGLTMHLALFSTVELVRCEHTKCQSDRGLNCV